ncbi:MAG: response regulator transcription factor [Acidobacteriota bacterium]
MDPIRVFFVQRYRLLTETLDRVLATRSDLSMVGDATEVETTLEAVATGTVDVVLIDASVPHGEALRAVRLLRDGRPELGIVPIGFDDIDDIVALIEAGANGYLLRDAVVENLITTIRAVARGETPCSPVIASAVFRRLAELGRRRPSRKRRKRDPRDTPLTPREIDVLRLMARGLRNKEIAQALAIRLPTVKNHVHHILTKLDLPDRRSVPRAALDLGLVSENDLLLPIRDA